MKTILSTCTFACFAFLTLSAETCGETHYISDSGFDLWCGDTLCNWEVLSGRVARASSWHRADYSVEMQGPDVVISQLSPRRGTSCLRFEMLADIEDDARVTLSMDFFDDGVVDYTQELAHARWESLVYFVSTPSTWRGVRFTLHKEGPGRARLAQIEAVAGSECFDKPIELTEKPLGALCISGAECESSICASSSNPSAWGQACSECSEDSDCPGDQVCGASGAETRSFLSPYRACVDAASQAIGQRCISGAECGTGVCCNGICSECCTGADCEGEVACLPAANEEFDSSELPKLCAGGEPGEVCVVDDDCDSGSCLGDLQTLVCLADGRECFTDSDCPGTSLDEPQCVLLGSDAALCQ